MKQASGARPNEALLRALGLGPDASRADVERVHSDLVDLLATAPASLQEWASSQAAVAESALAAYPADTTKTAPAATSSGTAKPVVNDAAKQAADDLPAPASAHDDGADIADLVDEDDLDAPAKPAKATSAKPALLSAKAAKPRRNRALLWLAALAAAAALLAGIFYFGDKSQPANPHASGMPTSMGTAAGMGGAGSTPTPVPVDENKAKELKAKIAANPQDTESMHQLAVMYFKANDMDSAGHWDEEILKIKPNDEDAMLELGVTKYNRNDLKSAEDLWRKVIQINDKNADAHFDLGFLYLNQDPPAMDKCEAEWQKVIDIDPSSDLAQYVSGYMKNHASAGPSAPASPSPTK